MMASWYYVVSKTREKSGPHEEADIRAKFIAGEIAPATLVWHDGLLSWIQAKEAFAQLQTPSGTSGKVPLPAGLRGWMAFCGGMTILLFLGPSLLLWGIPMLLAGFAILSVRDALSRTPYVDPDLLPFFARLKTFCSCWGWMYLLLLFVALLGLLLYVALALWALSTGDAAPLPLPFR